LGTAFKYNVTIVELQKQGVKPEVSRWDGKNARKKDLHDYGFSRAMLSSKCALINSMNFPIRRG
jgi:hypothetical protein